MTPRSPILFDNHARWRRCVPLALVTTLAACGGGGGTGEPLPTLPAGAYHAVTFKGFHGPPENVRTNVGTLLSNGVSLITDLGSIENENGVISADPGGPVIPYSLSAEGVLSVSDGLVEHFQGGLTANGKTFGLAAVFPGGPSESGLVLGLKKDAGLSDATLLGDYHACSFGALAGQHFANVGTSYFDGIGAVLHETAVANTDGVLAGGTSGVGAYAVADDGTFTLGGVLQGGASADGEHAIVGGGVVAGYLNQMFVFVRKAPAAALSSLSGTYTIVGIGYDLTEGRYSDVAGSVRVDGEGRATLSVSINREGLVSTLIWGGTYTVTDDGTLELTVGGGGHTYRGAISADGTFGMLGGGISLGADPVLFVLFRR